MILFVCFKNSFHKRFNQERKKKHIYLKKMLTRTTSLSNVSTFRLSYKKK